MRSRLIPVIALIVLLILTGCGMQHGENLLSHETTYDSLIDRLLSDGWDAYASGDYELAKTKFDSVVSIKVDEVYAYIGLSYVYLKLASMDSTLLADVQKYLNFAFALLEPVNIENEEITVGFSEYIDDSLRLQSQNIKALKAVLKSSKDRILYADVFSANAMGTIETLDIRRYGYDYVITDPLLDNLGYLYTPQDEDTLMLTLYHTEFADSIDYRLAATCIAQGQKYFIESFSSDRAEELIKKAIAYLRFVTLYFDTTDIFTQSEYLPSVISTKLAHILLAEIYYHQEMFAMALEEVLTVDPSCTLSTLDDDFVEELGIEIQRLMEEL